MVALARSREMKKSRGAGSLTGAGAGSWEDAGAGTMTVVANDVSRLFENELGH